MKYNKKELKVFNELREMLKEDILVRYGNPEYWDIRIIEQFQQDFPNIDFSNFK